MRHRTSSSESWGPRTLDRIWQAARPLLTIYGEQGRTFGISTPADGDDFYGRLFTQAENGALPGAVAFRASTQELNPAVADTFLEQERLLLGEGAFRREYLAEFSPGGGGAFLEEDAVAAVVGRYHELRPEQGTGWLIGLDVAFSRDPSAAVVVGRDPENRKRLLVGHAERWLPKRSRRQRRTAKTEQERWTLPPSSSTPSPGCRSGTGTPRSHDWPTTLAAYWFLAALMTSRMTLITILGLLPPLRGPCGRWSAWPGG